MIIFSEGVVAPSFKSYSRLTEQTLLNQLSGKEVIGLYPLLPDNILSKSNLENKQQKY